jgi:hypothetical protein
MRLALVPTVVVVKEDEGVAVASNLQHKLKHTFIVHLTSLWRRPLIAPFTRSGGPTTIFKQNCPTHYIMIVIMRGEGCA